MKKIVLQRMAEGGLLHINKETAHVSLYLTG